MMNPPVPESSSDGDGNCSSRRKFRKFRKSQSVGFPSPPAKENSGAADGSNLTLGSYLEDPATEMRKLYPGILSPSATLPSCPIPMEYAADDPLQMLLNEFASKLVLDQTAPKSVVDQIPGYNPAVVAMSCDFPQIDDKTSGDMPRHDPANCGVEDAGTEVGIHLTL